MIQTLNTFAAAWADALWKASWQGGFALILVWCICRFVPRISPAFKVWLWRLAWIKFLLAFFWNGSIELPLLSPLPPAHQAQPPKLLRLEGAFPEIAPATIVEPRLEAATVLFGLWQATVIAGLVRLGCQWRRSARLKCDSMPFENIALAELCSCLGIGKLPALRQSREISVPVLIGILRPAVIVPANARASELRIMLAHELAHLKRRDLVWAWLPAVCHTLFFFHPLLWLTRREWLLAQEMACDELALRHSAESPAAYGTMLIDLLSMRVPRARFGALGICEDTKNLKRRIIAMKMIGIRNSRLLTLALLIAGVTGILPWRIVAQPKPEDAAKRIEQLEKDNASLRQEMEKLNKASKKDQSLQLRMDLLNDRLQREVAIANLNLASNKLKRAQVLFDDKVESQDVLDIASSDVNKLQAEIAVRTKTIAEREAALAELGGNQTGASDARQFSSEDLRALETARLTQRAEAEISAAEADLKVLRSRYTDEHPVVVEAQKRLQRLKERQGSLKESPAGDSKRTAQERELYVEELKLAQNYAESMHRQMEAGRGTLEELVRAQRQVFGIQREIARLDGNRAQLRQVVQEEMKAVQRLLNEAKKRIEIGAASPGHDLDLQRDMLKLKRELLQLQD